MSLENPYQSPQESGGVPFAQGLGHHIRIVAILMLIQGGLELLLALGLLAMGGVMPWVFAAMPPPPPGQAGQVPLPGLGWIFGGIYLGMGVVYLSGAVLKLVAGWRNYRFRGRVLGIVALSSGLAHLFTCYCFPTALALFIYGLIVYLNGQSARWFELGARGVSPDEIRVTW